MNDLNAVMDGVSVIITLTAGAFAYLYKRPEATQNRWACCAANLQKPKGFQFTGTGTP
jgi:hypothetical protein